MFGSRLWHSVEASSLFVWQCEPKPSFGVQICICSLYTAWLWHWHCCIQWAAPNGEHWACCVHENPIRFEAESFKSGLVSIFVWDCGHIEAYIANIKYTLLRFYGYYIVLESDYVFSTFNIIEYVQFIPFFSNNPIIAIQRKNIAVKYIYQF